MTQGEVGTEIDGPLELEDGLIMGAAQPQRPAHGPVRSGVTIVDHEAAPRGFEGTIDFRLGFGPVLESILEVRERQAGVSAREGRI